MRKVYYISDKRGNEIKPQESEMSYQEALEHVRRINNPEVPSVFTPVYTVRTRWVDC